MKAAEKLCMVLRSFSTVLAPSPTVLAPSQPVFLPAVLRTGAAMNTAAQFIGEGSYIELPTRLLPHRRDNAEEIVKLTVTTTQENALLFWHGQTPTMSGHNKDYIAVAIRNGYPIFRCVPISMVSSHVRSVFTLQNYAVIVFMSSSSSSSILTVR